MYYIDGDKMNFQIENLEWVTGSENQKHSFKIGLKKAKKGIDAVNASLSAEDVRYIRKNYKFKDRKFGGRALAKKFNVCHSTILNVIHNRSYTDIV